MQYFKKIIFYIIERSNLVARILLKIWILYTSTKGFIKLFLYKYTNIKIKTLSDRGQDLWVVELFHFDKEYSTSNKKNFFLEIGAGDGFLISNTFILEKYYNWTGILVEPNPEQFNKLKKNRGSSSCILSNDLVWSKKKKINFFKDGDLSKVITNENNNISKNAKNYLTLDAISLEELLIKYNAPKIIDFFSLDVEGCEDEVLIPCLKKYIFLSLTIERPSALLNSHLFSNDYFFVKNSLYDSFYVHKSIKNFDQIKKEPFFQLPSKNF
tara:strand:+ start:6175 stop:6981 length:807 start_codon:yes stop_codon:yes gene_type:complete